MMTLAELIAAYKNGKGCADELTLAPLVIDNDYVSAECHDEEWEKVEEVFWADPGELLEQLLTLVGIPHQHV